MKPLWFALSVVTAGLILVATPSRAVADESSTGAVAFGNAAPLTVGGVAAPISGYARYDNPWSHTPFDAGVVRIADRHGGAVLDFTHGRRGVYG